MNFFKLRILNTSLIFIIGILLGFVLKDKAFTPKNNHLPAQGIRAKTNTGTSPVGSQSSFDSFDEKEEYNVFDDDEVYDIPVRQKQIKNKPIKETDLETITENDEVEFVKFMDFSDPFFKNPKKFKNELVSMDIQMIFAKKGISGWRLNLMHVDSQRGVKYVYLDSDLLVSDKINLKIGYFYRVYFKCTRGELNKGNILLSIAPTGKKADWATGISAIE